MGAVTTVTIAAEHPALAGHFPGAPILPGVLLLDEMVRAVEQERAQAGARWRIAAESATSSGRKASWRSCR